MSLVHQNVLVNQLKSLFPNEKPHINSRKQSQLKYTSEKHSAYLELDVWFPNLNVCFEFQDNYHYVTTWYYNKSIHQILKNDNSKKDIVKWNEIRLVVVPCWWDGSIESLRGTIYFCCPDLLDPSSKEPIPLNPPFNFFPDRVIPHVGELMYASFLVNPKMIAQNSWWLGEKYDGIRGCWNPANSTVYTRQGTELELLPHFYKLIPRIAIDGEFWFGRGNFALTHQLTYKSPDLIAWDAIRFVAFDNPSINVQRFPFEYRYRLLLTNLPQDNPFILLASRFLLPSASQLNFFVQKIIEDEGEGVILRKVKSLYKQGRSSSLLKFKLSLEDREAIVLKVEPNGVQLKLPNGELFTIPLQNIYIKNIQVGEIVTFSCENQNFNTRNIISENMIIHRRREDISWKDVLHSFLEEQKFLSATPFFSKATSFSVYQMRKYLENFANKKYLDPLVPKTWYSISDTELRQFKKGRKIIKIFKGYQNAIQKLFSEINFEINSFNSSVWSEVDGKRKVFEKFAKENQFDPLDPEHWYIQSRTHLLSDKNAKRIVQQDYKNNVSKALVDLFPEIGFDRTRFWDSTWKEEAKRRQQLEKFAEENKFDPLDPEQWYLQPRQKLLSFPGVHRIMDYHGGSLIRALLELFPEIGLEQSNFNRVYTMWRNPKVRRMFFEKYAEKKKFDPLVPTNWYSQSLSEILSEKGIRGILAQHGESLISAITELFPEIGLEKSSFDRAQWRYPTKRRKFFETYAKEHGFDPLNPEYWYSHAGKMQKKDVRHILFYHRGSIMRALLELFPEIGLEKSQFKIL